MLCEFHIEHCQLSRLYLIHTTFLKSNLFFITCWGKDLTPLGRYEGLRISKMLCICSIPQTMDMSNILSA
jgi:hypothetical protein